MQHLNIRRAVAAVAAATLVATAALPTHAQPARSPAGDIWATRDQWQRVPEILTALGAAPGQRIADIAAGQGFLTRPLSRRVGRSGRVFAVEISEDARRALIELAERGTLGNVEVVAGTESDPRIPGPIDGAVVLNAYHEMADHATMLEAIRNALRPGGLLVMVDNTNLGAWAGSRREQVSHHSIDPAFVEAELRAAGFEIAARQDEFIVQPIRQWLIVARRPARLRSAAKDPDGQSTSPPLTGVGILLAWVVPSPSWPPPLAPQQ